MIKKTGDAKSDRYLKMRHKTVTKTVLQSVSGITKCDRYYKLRRNSGHVAGQNASLLMNLDPN